MSRRKVKVSRKVQAEIAARTARGDSARKICADLGVASPATIARMQAELRAKALPDAAPATAADDASDVPDDPEGASLAELNRWIVRLEAAATKAEVAGNLGVLASIAAKVTALLNLRHKSAPVARLDPDENPDYQALAHAAEARLVRLAHAAFART